MGVLRRRHLMACLISSTTSRSGWSSGQTELICSGLAPLVVKTISFCVQISPLDITFDGSCRPSVRISIER